MDSCPQERVGRCCCIVLGGACSYLAERGSKAHGSKYLPRNTCIGLREAETFSTVIVEFLGLMLKVYVYIFDSSYLPLAMQFAVFYICYSASSSGTGLRGGSGAVLGLVHGCCHSLCMVFFITLIEVGKRMLIGSAHQGQGGSGFSSL